MIQAAIRASLWLLPVLVIAGAIVYVVNSGTISEMAGESSAPPKSPPDTGTLLGYDDPDGFPFKLKALFFPPHGWRTVGFYPDRRICEAAKLRYMERHRIKARCERR